MELEIMLSEDPSRNSLRKFKPSVTIVSSIISSSSSAMSCYMFVAVNAEFPSLSPIMSKLFMKSSSSSLESSMSKSDISLLQLNSESNMVSRQ